MARKHRDLRLNLLLAQCSRGSTVFRELLKKQLSVWDKIGATDFIMVERLRIYALLAGLVVWETGKLILSSCNDVEWQRNLAVHLWSVVCVCVCARACVCAYTHISVYLHLILCACRYCCHPTATIADALNRYNDTLNVSNIIDVLCMIPSCTSHRHTHTHT